MSKYTPEQLEALALSVQFGGNYDADDVVEVIRAYAATLRQQAGRVDEGLVDELRAEAKLHYGSNTANDTADLLIRAAAALAQNTQGEAVVHLSVADEIEATPLIGAARLPHGDYMLHAERARVPDGYSREWLESLAESLQSGAEFIKTDTQGRGYKRDANLESAAAFIRAVLAAAPSQRAEVDRG